MREFQHPTLLQYAEDWERYRLTFEGGRQFIDKYLRKYHTHEDVEMYMERKRITYCPAFASAAVTEINNTLFSRMPDVIRLVDSDSYNNTVKGLSGGVDYKGVSIDNFIGCHILPELTMMGKVGVYVDMPTEVPIVGSISENTVHPYYYTYNVEDIISWEYGLPGSGHEFTKLLLRDNFYKNEKQFGLTSSVSDNFRLLEVADGGIRVTFLDSEKEIQSTVMLNLKKIPFVMFKLKHSLLKNVADYQIALLNMESTDVDFACKVNFPIYTEQSSYLTSLPNAKPEEQDTQEPQSGQHKRNLGSKHGVRYSKGSERPDFINPSAEPLLANIEKENNIKRDIRQLVHLNVSSLGAQTVSKESKNIDRESLENGLSLISLVLEEGERKLACFWNDYESNDSQVSVSYPRNFDLRTEDDRRVEAEKLIQLSRNIASDTFQREMLKRVVTTLIGTKVTVEILDKIKEEIDQAPTLSADSKTILSDLEAGLVTAVTASKIRGYNENEAKKAQKEKQERLSFIAKAQGGEVGEARGNSDFEDVGDTSALEKQNKNKRGEGKLNV